MRVSFVELRKRSSEILRALNRNEPVMVLYGGQPKAVMLPLLLEVESSGAKVADHSAFGLWAHRGDLKDVARHVRRLRRGKLDAS